MNSAGRTSLATRIFAIAALLFAEKFALNFFVDFDAAQAAQGFGGLVRVAQHLVFRFLVTLAIALSLFVWVRDRQRWAALSAAAIGVPLRVRWLAAHALLLLPLAALSSLLYGPHAGTLPFGAVVALWLSCAFAAVTALFAAMAPWTMWVRATREIGVLWLYATAAAAAAAATFQWSQSLWMGLTRVTFEAVRYLLLPLIPNLQTYPDSAVIDAGHFAVQVAPICSGVEGMGLMLIFCIAWLVLFRQEYIFPRALVIVPAGVVLIFMLNAVRIAALVLIGQAGLRDIAIYGFHSQAGWIAFNCSAGLVAFASRKSPWLNRTALRETGVETRNPTAAYLVPFLAILAAGMVARALSSGFETLYMLRPLAAGLALGLYWRRLTTLDWRTSWRGPLTGVAAFALWAFSAHFLTSPTTIPHELAAMQPVWRESWIAIRLIASISIVPVCEELAFRGFLMRRIVSADFESVSFMSVRQWPVIVSAIAFGLGHGVMWLPAATVGILYGALLVRTGRMGEAVAAHATTNVLVAACVLVRNQWQLWL